MLKLRRNPALCVADYRGRWAANTPPPCTAFDLQLWEQAEGSANNQYHHEGDNGQLDHAAPSNCGSDACASQQNRPHVHRQLVKKCEQAMSPTAPPIVAPTLKPAPAPKPSPAEPPTTAPAIPKRIAVEPLQKSIFFRPPEIWVVSVIVSCRMKKSFGRTRCARQLKLGVGSPSVRPGFPTGGRVLRRA